MGIFGARYAITDLSERGKRNVLTRGHIQENILHIARPKKRSTEKKRTLKSKGRVNRHYIRSK